MTYLLIALAALMLLILALATGGRKVRAVAAVREERYPRVLGYDSSTGGRPGQYGHVIVESAPRSVCVMTVEDAKSQNIPLRAGVTWQNMPPGDYLCNPELTTEERAKYEN